MPGFSDAVITFRRLETPDDAAHVPFAGSPTMTLNGEDLFPTGTRTSELVAGCIGPRPAWRARRPPSNSSKRSPPTPADGCGAS